MALDNAAKIYPASKRKDWTALFRVSAELNEDVDPAALEKAQMSALARFPCFDLTLKRGFFWYYLEQNEGCPDLQPDVANPCVRLLPRDNKGFMFRVRYYRRRIALEVYHALSDGSGGLCFFKTLVAEYLRLKYGAVIPRGDGILDCAQTPDREESEDAFLRYAKNVTHTRKESNAFHLRGTDESDDFINITTGFIPVRQALEKAREKGVSLTVYLTGAVIMALDKIQREQSRGHKKLRPVKVGVPVDLRQFYDTRTMRNFSSYVNPGIDPNLGEYSFDEVLKIVHHHLGTEITEKQLNVKFTTNVRVERVRILRMMPLFIKNLAMRATFNRVGDRRTTTTISNLRNVTLPPEMALYVRRLDLILGPLSRNRIVCGVLSYQDDLVINVTRTIKESLFEREFFRFLVRQGLHVKIESNRGW